MVAEAAAVRAQAAEQAHDQRRAAALAQAVNALGRAVTELENQLMPTFTELQEVLLTHAFELAEAIVGRTLDDPQRRGADALRRAMAAAPDAGPLVVRLRPVDLEHAGRPGEPDRLRPRGAAGEPAPGRLTATRRRDRRDRHGDRGRHHRVRGVSRPGGAAALSRTAEPERRQR